MVPRPELCSGCIPVGSGYNTAELMLRSPLANFSAKVSCRQFLPQDEHITLVTPWTRASALIQEDNGVLHIPVHKIHPEFGAIDGPPWAPLDRTVNWWVRPREGHLVLHWGGREQCWCGCGCGTSRFEGSFHLDVTIWLQAHCFCIDAFPLYEIKSSHQSCHMNSENRRWNQINQCQETHNFPRGNVWYPTPKQEKTNWTTRKCRYQQWFQGHCPSYPDIVLCRYWSFECCC